MTVGRRAACVLFACILPGCTRGCTSTVPVSPPVQDIPPTSPSVSSRCVREITRAAVFLPPGTGDIDSVLPACTGDTLALYVLRSDVLSRATRSLRPGAGFGRTLTISTGADRVGAINPTTVDGPIAWRSPIAGLDLPERDDLWTALVISPDGGTDTVLRGDVLMPAGVIGLGAPVVGQSLHGRIELLATIARAGEDPLTARVSVSPGHDGVEIPAGAAPRVLDGELRAWEPLRGVALTRVVQPSGDVVLQASRPGGVAVSLPMTAREVLVAPRGADAAGETVFATAGFALGGDAGTCLDIGGMCVTPGPVELLVATAGSLRRVTVAPSGLPDTVTAQGHEVTVMYVDETGSQRAARVSLPEGHVHLLTLVPPEGMPSMDHPALVTCEDGVWLAMEVALGTDDGGTHSAVTAAPLECFVR